MSQNSQTATPQFNYSLAPGRFAVCCEILQVSGGLPEVWVYRISEGWKEQPCFPPLSLALAKVGLASLKI